MAQDFEGIGRTAGECVLRRIAQPDTPFVTHVFPARLVVRRSSGLAPASPPLALPEMPSAARFPPASAPSRRFHRKMFPGLAGAGNNPRSCGVIGSVAERRQ